MTLAAALHPERTDDPRVVSWVTTLLATTCLSRIEDVLPDLRRAGSVATVDLRPGYVDVRAADPDQWRRLGPAVRRELGHDIQRAVARHGADDEVLLEVAEKVLEQSVAELVRSHGGQLRVVSARDGVVTVARSGACGHCPAAAITVNSRFEQALRAQLPTLRGVRSVSHGTDLGRSIPLTSSSDRSARMLDF